TVVPLTAVGRATMAQLSLNRERIIPIRADDVL
ncbi:MAG: HNH endonuclease, partial [Anaerolineae bacterium]|nr:HNH endonuclease [Anaerolineae bacterium]